MSRVKHPRHPLLLTVSETSLVLRVHRPKVYELLRDGTITGFKIGSDWRIKRESVEKLVGPIPADFFDGTEKKPKREKEESGGKGPGLVVGG